MVKNAEDVASEILKFCPSPSLLTKQEIVPFLENEYVLSMFSITLYHSLTSITNNITGTDSQQAFELSRLFVTSQARSRISSRTKM